MCILRSGGRLGCLIGLLAVALSYGQAQAQSSQSYSSGNMWGTQPTGVAVPGMVESAIAHNQDGQSAALVNSAKKGLLLGGPGVSITAIGSQSIVNTTVIGNNNDVDISANQSSSNSGSVNNSGSFSSK